MDRINTPTKQANLFGAGKHGFRDGDTNAGISPTDLDAAWFNDLQEELLAIIEGVGIAPAAGQRSQVYQAIQLLIANATRDFKLSVRFATTANIVLAGLATQAGGDWSSALTSGDRVLAQFQTAAADRGLYIANAGAWTRASDADGVGEMTSGMLVAVEEGTTYADSTWMLTTDGVITPGVTALTFAKQGGSGSLVNVVRYTTAGSGTYNKPSNVTKIVVRVKGAGGGGSGGYGDYGGGGGGGGGAYAEKLISSPAASYAYSIGAGGVGTPYGGVAASPGGATSIAGITCNGGLGGHEVNSGTVGAGGLGGTASGGDLNVPGDGGGSGGIKGGANGSSSGGVGGGGYLGGAGRAGSSGIGAGNGSHGGGGGGGGHGNAGGNGGAGFIEIEEYA